MISRHVIIVCGNDMSRQSCCDAHFLGIKEKCALKGLWGGCFETSDCKQALLVLNATRL